MIRRLGKLGLLRAIHPALPYDSRTIQQLGLEQASPGATRAHTRPAPAPGDGCFGCEATACADQINSEAAALDKQTRRQLLAALPCTSMPQVSPGSGPAK